VVHCGKPLSLSLDISGYLPYHVAVITDYSADGGLDRLKMQLLPDELDDFRTKNRTAMIVK
jgi:hypothetical protein